MAANETKGLTVNESKDSRDFLLYLEAEKADPPTRAAAKLIWDEFIAALEKLVGHKEKQERFLSILGQNIKPISTDRASSAAAFPADHAYNLFEQIKELDCPWYRRYARRLIRWGSGAGIGALLKWWIDDFALRWIGFCLAVSIGYLVMDDFYDGGSIGSAAVIGLLVAVLLSLPEGKPKRRAFRTF